MRLSPTSVGEMDELFARAMKACSATFSLPSAVQAASASASGTTSARSDDADRRVLMGCVNAVMAVMDADTGRVVATLPNRTRQRSGRVGSVRRRSFSSHGVDGTITVYQRAALDRYQALEPIRTAVSGRTMTIDEGAGRLFVATADTTPNPTPGGRARVVPGTLRVLAFDPVP